MGGLDASFNNVNNTSATAASASGSVGPGLRDSAGSLSHMLQLQGTSTFLTPADAASAFPGSSRAASQRGTPVRAAQQRAGSAVVAAGDEVEAEAASAAHARFDAALRSVAAGLSGLAASAHEAQALRASKLGDSGASTVSGPGHTIASAESAFGPTATPPRASSSPHNLSSATANPAAATSLSMLQPPPSASASSLGQRRRRRSSALDEPGGLLSSPARAAAASEAAVVRALEAAHDRIRRLQEEAERGAAAAAAAAAEAERRVLASLTASTASSLSGVEQFRHLATELSAAHAHETAALTAQLRVTREALNRAHAELEAAAATPAAAPPDVQVVITDLRQRLAAETARADKAAARVKALRAELLKMAADADARIAAEVAGRHAAEATCDKLKAALEAQRRRFTESDARVAELAAALELTTTTLRVSQERSAAASVAGASSEREAKDLRSVLDRTAASLSAIAASASANNASADGAPNATQASGGAPSGRLQASSGDSLSTALHLNDLTQRLSAYVKAGRRRGSTISASTVSSASSGELRQSQL